VSIRKNLKVLDNDQSMTSLSLSVSHFNGLSSTDSSGFSSKDSLSVNYFAINTFGDHNSVFPSYFSLVFAIIFSSFPDSAYIHLDEDYVS
jgi:hypothetical protein